MKVISTCRSRNDENIIGRFCKAYQEIADVILIADGGSEDDTVKVAESFPKVKVIHFEEQMPVRGGHEINPQGRHVNFIFDHAIALGADWITFDDSDCVPNYLLQQTARRLMKDVEEYALFLRRVYFWGSDLIFPKLHEPNTSLWAFKPSAGIRADEADSWHLTMAWRSQPNLINLRPVSRHIDFPYCLLHYSWPTPEEAQEKVRWYRESGVQPTCIHPLHWAGPTEPAAWFMSEKAPNERTV